MDFFKTKKGLLILGIFAGLGAVALALGGNPKNMAICIACFIRDSAGAMKFHTAAPVQYFRPEIVGMVLGALAMAVASKEYRSTGGSSPVTRFVLGAIMMIGALVFLGCPLRMVLRMASGDISSYIGLVGFIGGVGAGSFMLKKGFSLGRSYTIRRETGLALPAVLTFFFILSLVTTLFVTSEAGPGSMYAPVILSLAVGLIFGAIAQRTRMCFAGSIRDVILMKDFTLLSVIGGIFVTMLVYNIATNNFNITAFGPIAHSQTLWNILGMFVVGFAAVLLGGCPLRQLILAGSGSSDAGITVLGMFLGAGLAHNFGLAAGAAANATADAPAALGGPGPYGQAAIVICIAALFIISFNGLRKRVAAPTTAVVK